VNIGITKPDYDKKLQEITDKLQLLRIEHEEHAKADHNYQTTVAQVLFVARRAKQIFESSETNEKRDFINYLVQNPVVKEKNLYFTMRSPFDLVLRLTERPSWLGCCDSNLFGRQELRSVSVLVN
jgi:site-specific DNA recombinase